MVVNDCRLGPQQNKGMLPTWNTNLGTIQVIGDFPLSQSTIGPKEMSYCNTNVLVHSSDFLEKQAMPLIQRTQLQNTKTIWRRYGQPYVLPSSLKLILHLNKYDLPNQKLRQGIKIEKYIPSYGVKWYEGFCTMPWIMRFGQIITMSSLGSRLLYAPSFSATIMQCLQCCSPCRCMPFIGNICLLYSVGNCQI